jgi:hypothetical protein
MKTIQCKQCSSVMGLVRETPRWELYKCFSCRHVMGRIHDGLKQREFKDATREMDNYADSLFDEEYQSVSPEELKRRFERNETNNISDEVVAATQARPKRRRDSCDWLSALQSYEFMACRIVDRDEGWTCVECVGKYGIYRAFLHALGVVFKFQWILRHPSIAQLNKREQDDLVKRVAQASSGVALEFKENMARVRVQHIGIPDDYYLAVEESVREVDTVIPILLSTVGQPRQDAR